MVLTRPGRRGRRHAWPARAWSSAYVARELAVGGQLLDLQRPGRRLRRRLPAAATAPTRRTTRRVALAAVEAFLGGGERGARPRCGAGGLRGGRLARPAGGRAAWPDGRCWTRPTTPPGRRAGARRSTRRSRSTAGRRGRRCWGTRTRGHARGARAGAREIVVTQNSSPRAMPAEELAEVADEVFGDERVSVAPRLADAIEAGGRAGRGRQRGRRRRAGDRLGRDRRRGAHAARPTEGRMTAPAAPPRGLMAIGCRRSRLRGARPAARVTGGHDRTAGTCARRGGHLPARRSPSS